ncbi:DNA (cytosine-5-)-methyltransferase [Spiroplasma endosymbiont of Amphibalanus improvisus]|uniref:DNA (cytosine-5-)-methyltransferase n=1 Tax=Spiroplasma endosymbiont of Amphibalanus improvisus TaxID=3066327 RepID=UPI00313D438C
MSANRPIVSFTISISQSISAIIAYNKIHNTSPEDKNKFNKLYNDNIDKIKQYLSNFNFSNDSKKPIKDLNKLNEKLLRELYAANIMNNNLGDITKIAASDIKEKIDLLTYSFPCQDLSICGKGLGMAENANTRSSLLWNVYRLLNELKDEEKLPKYLLLENVVAINNKKNKKDLNLFKDKLSQLGYTSYDLILDSSNFGIPQKRQRFYMVSILNSQKQEIIIKERKLNYKLKDFINFNDLKNANREEQYVKNIEENIRQNDIAKNKILNTKFTKLNVYPTFQQANIVTGINCDTIPTITFSGENSRQRILGIINNQYSVRQLGSKENFLLMGFTETDYNRLKKNDSILRDSIINSLAGNSIVVNVLEEIFKQMFEL